MFYIRRVVIIIVVVTGQCHRVSVVEGCTEDTKCVGDSLRRGQSTPSEQLVEMQGFKVVDFACLHWFFATLSCVSE